ncbi:MAG: TlpA family protein disulfide reductase [Saprospiraceae bacterium]|uniref:TlpA family protein disulfide reductase n=1 Tax=Candidatus Opimibacter skivensis TaxID=2982028 RepID=A0A9D7XPL9_9BACT|nr:TlpA family protein disulfide reductase [Candidatus Opimibacter skivensis]
MFYTALFILSFYSFPASGVLPNALTLPTKDTLFIPVYNYDELKPLITKDNDTTYVINFWATWCTPCVQELPYFVELNKTFKNQAFRLILVSLDFKKDYIRKLQPFVVERSLESNVVVLEDNHSSYWIDDIDKTWSGSIPATLVFKGNQRAFYERTFHDPDELKEIVKPYLNL